MSEKDHAATRQKRGHILSVAIPPLIAAGRIYRCPYFSYLRKRAF
jgi:hypothetical protein